MTETHSKPAEAIDPVLPEGPPLSLEQLCGIGCVDEAWVIERVEAGLIATMAQGGPAVWRFDTLALRRVRRMAALERDFDAVPELAALVSDLEDELERLRQRLASGSPLA